MSAGSEWMDRDPKGWDGSHRRELVTGVLRFTAREAGRLPLALARLPVVAIHRGLLLSESLCRGTEELAQWGAAAIGWLPARQPTGRNWPGPPRYASENLPDNVPPVPAPAPDPPAPSAEELAIPDFDHVTAGSLRGRLRRLRVDELRALRRYEQTHARRRQILTMLENRIGKLDAQTGTPSESGRAPAARPRRPSGPAAP